MNVGVGISLEGGEVTYDLCEVTCPPRGLWSLKAGFVIYIFRTISTIKNGIMFIIYPKFIAFY